MGFRQFLDRIAQWVRRFFHGRRGVDQLCVTLLIVALLCSMAATLFGLPWLLVPYYGGLLLCLWRMLSRNIPVRNGENQRFLAVFGRVPVFLRRTRNRFRDRKTYTYVKCPRCGQFLRLPRGKGTVEVICASCGERFVKKV